MGRGRKPRGGSGGGGGGRVAQQGAWSRLHALGEFYAPAFAPERWARLREALLRDARHCALANKFAHPEDVARTIGLHDGSTEPLAADKLRLRAFVKRRRRQLPSADSAPPPPAPATAPSEEATANPPRVSPGAPPGAPSGADPAFASPGPEDLSNTAEAEQVEEAVPAPPAAAAATTPHVAGKGEDEKEAAARPAAHWRSPGAPESLDRRGLCCFYLMDAASLLPVEALLVDKDHRVLDLCAAPGGKSLAILQHFTATSAGELVCNDVSADRRERLSHVLREYLPQDMLPRVQLTGVDGTERAARNGFALGGGGGGAFDRVLVDAPCSSERHVMHKPDELLRWAPGRSKANADRQLQLLSTALQLCRVGGRVVYSTCSLSPLENDEVVQRAVRRLQGKVEGKITVRSLATRMPFGEPTALGWHVLPDATGGWGPIYLAALERTPGPAPGT